MTQGRFAHRAWMFALFIGGCGEGAMSPEQHLERAGAALEQGEVRTAVIELKNALQVAPDNRDARRLLGETYARYGDGASAEKELRRAVELGASELDVQPWLARALFLQGELQPISELEVPASAPAETRAEMLRIKAEALLASGELGAADSTARQALELQADSAPVMTTIARILFQRKDTEQAKEWISKALASDKAYGAAWSLLGQLERSQGNTKAAEEAYTNAMEDPRLLNTARFERALVLIDMQEWDRARADIEQLRALGRKDPRINYAEGLLKYKQNNYAEAAQLFEAVLGVSPDYAPALYYAGASRLALGNAATASKHLTGYLAQQPENIAARRLMALASMQLGHPQEAEKFVKRVVERYPEDVTALNLLADSLILQGKREESVAYLRRVTAAQPESTNAQARLGAALVDQGDTEEGIRELEEAFESDPASQGIAEQTIRGYARSGNTDKAVEAARQNRDRNPDSAPAHALLGMMYLLQNEKKLAAAAFSKALDLAPGHPVASAGLAGQAMEDGQVEKAKEYLVESLKHHPGNPGVLNNLAKIAETEGDRGAAKMYLRDAIEQSPEALAPRLLLARLYLTEREPENCLAVLEPVRQANPANLQMLMLAAQAEVGLARYGDAKATLEALRDLSPEVPAIRDALARVYAMLGDTGRARAEYEKAFDLDPSFAPAIKGLARLAVERRDLPETEALVQQLKDVVGSDDPDVFALEGAIAEMKGDLRGAVGYYEQAHSAARTRVSLLLLTRMQWKTGDVDAALRAMEQWADEHPEDIPLQFELVARYLDLERTEEAIDWQKRIVDADPENAVALNNLAWLLRGKEPAKAVEFAQRAHSINPDSAAILDTLAMAHLANGDTERAVETSERAVRKSPGNASFLFHRAQILEAADEHEDARLALENALQSGKQFPEREQAQAMLSRLRAE